jgi:hypothetical protein
MQAFCRVFWGGFLVFFVSSIFHLLQTDKFCARRESDCMLCFKCHIAQVKVNLQHI